MSAYLFGLATLPAIALVVYVAIVAIAPTSTVGLACGCGADWGNPKERGWTWWWQRLRVGAHDLTPQHRAWRRTAVDQ